MDQQDLQELMEHLDHKDQLDQQDLMGVDISGNNEYLYAGVTGTEKASTNYNWRNSGVYFSR